MESNKNEALKQFRAGLSDADREWFDERTAIIQYSQETEMPEIEAARHAYKCFSQWADKKK